MSTSEYHRQYYQNHREEILVSVKENYEANAPHKLAYAKRWWKDRPPEVKERHRVRNRERMRLLRQDVLERFGTTCAHCGFDDQRALHVDHINGRGREERRRFKGAGPYYKYLLNEANLADYQILCANCNIIKQHENQEFATLERMYNAST